MTTATTTKERKPRAKRPPKVGRTTLTIDTFDIRVNLADGGACGTIDEDIINACCSLSTRQLDGSGFVTETRSLINAIKFAFDPTKMLRASCEQVAAGITQVLCTVLGDRLDRAVVTVENTSGNVTFVWRKRMQLPEFPRFATADERNATMQRRKSGARRVPC